jgi:hypothetical protein
MAIDGEIEIQFRGRSIAETVRLLREKFNWPASDLLAARRRLKRIGHVVKPKEMIA